VVLETVTLRTSACLAKLRTGIPVSMGMESRPKHRVNQGQALSYIKAATPICIKPLEELERMAVVQRRRVWEPMKLVRASDEIPNFAVVPVKASVSIPIGLEE